MSRTVTSSQSLFLASLLLVGAAGCGSCTKGCDTRPEAAQPQQGNRVDVERSPPEFKRVTIKAEWIKCQEDKDCVHVPGDCCGCRAGGTDVVLNPAHLEEYGAARLSTCSDVVCPQVMSDHVSCKLDARCKDGQCILISRAAGAQRVLRDPNIQRVRDLELQENRIPQSGVPVSQMDASVPTKPIEPAPR